VLNDVDSFRDGVMYINLNKAIVPVDGNKIDWEEMEKARFTKYKSKKPDGKGGWIYDYGDTKKKTKKSKPVKNIFEISKQNLIKNPIKGFEYSDDNSYVARRDRQNKITYVSDRFFDLSETSKKMLLNHEVGHDLIQHPTDFNKYFKDVLEPFRVDKDQPLGASSKYEDFFGQNTQDVPEEVLANAYMGLLTGMTKGYIEDNPSGKVAILIDKIIQRAKELKLPLPKAKR
jgi:hypothetical protein